MMRPCPPYGPRSLMRTTVLRPLRRLITRTRVFMCSVRCAAVNAYMSNRSPLAVRCPCCSRPYHDALPSSTATTPARDGGGTSRTVDVGGSVLAQPATAANAKATIHSLRLAASGIERLLAQLVAGHAVAERGARLLAVTLAEDVAQVRHEREGVGVLLGMAVVGAQPLGWPPQDGARLVEPGLLDVLRARAVAGLALHVDEPALLDGGEVGAARLVP